MEQPMEDPPFMLNSSCFQFVPVYSPGIWNLKPGEDIFSYMLIRLFLQLAVIFVTTSFLHFFLKFLQLSRFISEYLAGIILGPTILGYYYPNVSSVLFSPQSDKVLSTLSHFGFLCFVFLIGAQMDVSLVKKSGTRAWVIGTLNFILPMFMVGLTGQISGSKGGAQDWTKLYGTTLAVTQFPVVACLLMHLKIINSELGRLAMASALIGDFLSLIVVSVICYLIAMTQASVRVGVGSLFLSLVLLLSIMFIARPIMFWIIRRTPEGKPVKQVYVVLIMATVFFLASIGDDIGVQFLIGPFIFGLAVPTGPPLASTLIERFDTAISGFLIPLFSTYAGLKSNLRDLSQINDLSLPTVLLLASKIAAAFIPAVLLKMPVKDAAAFSILLCVKGVMELGSFTNFSNDQLMDEKQFTAAVFVIFIIAIIVPPLIRMLYDSSRKYTGYQKRSILHSSNNTELKILACAIRQDDAVAAIKLLENSNPTKESPISVYGLYLEELTGGTTPIIINHQFGQINSSRSSHSQSIFDVFNYFKSEHKKLAQVQLFSAISPPKVMHDDICWVGFDKSVSLIILPFHKRWNTKGKIISDSNALRTLNINVLEKSPSSVGILVDRRKTLGPTSVFVSSSTYRVAVLYLGGKDDMEALAYAKRMAGCSRIYVTVIRFTESNYHGYGGGQNLHDEASLRDIKRLGSKVGNISYREEIVRDGSDTATIIKSLGDRYDLIIVGRRHEDDSTVTLGLSEWSELPELGPIGDLLASSDITGAVSVLIMQQQIIDRK